MTRLAWPRLLACLATAVAACGGALVATPAPATAAATAAATASDESGTSPLRVTIETLAPATIPAHGSVRLTGRIVNESDQTWSALNAYLLTSASPIRTREELARAAASAANAPVGSRQAKPGLYDQVGDLAPGQSVRYRLSVSRKDLGISGEPGVYWVGVHVLGASDAGRDSLADGRARTFMPLLPARGTPEAGRDRTRLALVVPLKEPVQRGAAGRLADEARWAATLAPEGRLDRLLRLSADSTVPMTWAVDPAVLDAARSVADGNPGLETSARGRRSSGPSSGPSPAPSSRSSPSPSASAGSSGQGEAGSPGETSSAARAARRWLAEFRRQAGGRSVAALPYGDLDVASALAADRSAAVRAVYPRAARLSRSTLAAYGVADPSPLVDPASGYLPASALSRVKAPATVLLTETAFPGATEPVVSRPGQAPVVLTDQTAGSGGPAPNSPYAALEMRQRILSESALHAMSAQRDTPLVVSTPSYWNPGTAWSTSRFFAGLDQRWLQMVDLSSVVATSSSGPDDGAAPVYPEADRVARVPVANLQATNRLTRTGEVYGRLLTADSTVEGVLARTALLASSTSVRGHASAALNQAVATDGLLRAQMSTVRVEDLGFVMMSGESGPIQITVVNGLQHTVRVGLRVSTPGSDLRIDPVNPVTLGPGQRTSIRLKAHSSDIGVHAVRIRTTDVAGASLGGETRFSVRTSNVSTVIWVIMAAGGALLLLAIVIRLIRRVRRRKSTHGPLLPPDPVQRPGHQVGA